jgi:uncharacterized peroxidase-related enzyme
VIAWISIVEPEDASGLLKELYEQVTTPHGTVDNVMKAHSLRPHTMAGHLALYRSVLHNDDNVLPLWFLEAVAVYTSLTNKCSYSVAHHFTNVRRLLKNEARATAMYEAFAAGEPEREFEGKELALFRYARKLTASPGDMDAADVAEARAAGASDGEILEVNQVCAYFNYSNRLLNGLGVTTDGDQVGYYEVGED